MMTYSARRRRTRLMHYVRATANALIIGACAAIIVAAIVVISHFVVKYW
jgi:hypothetical protein